MGDCINIPRPALNLFPTALHRGILVSMLERVDDSGQLTISMRAFAEEIGVSYQTLRTVIAKLSSNAIINATATQGATQGATHRLTQISFCGYDTYGYDCRTPQRKEQRKEQRKSNASSNATSNRITEWLTSFVNPIFMNAFSTWLEYKKRQFDFEYKTEPALKAVYSELILLSKGDPALAMKIVEQSMSNGWKGLFELKINNNNNNNEPRIKTQDKFTARRGTDIGDLTESDYGGPF